MVTPVLRYIAHITLWGVVKSFLTTAVVLGVIGTAVWKIFVVKEWVEDVVYEGNVDANKALEDLNDEDDGKEKEDVEAKKGKGKKK
jgi:hypothetical protein